MDFRDKCAVVTGGANGIGKYIVSEFTKAGTKTAVIDMSSDEPECDLYFRGDIADKETLADFSKTVIARFGKIDYIINNAMLSRKGILDGCSYEDFVYVQKVGVAAPYLLTLYLKDYFREGGAIVNIASTRAKMSQPDTESYTAAKGGILALTHALAISLAGKVRVNSVSPGWIDVTQSQWSKEDLEQHPVKRIGDPADIAKTVLFLCSDYSGFITGEDITVDGGMSRLMIYHNDFGWSYGPR